jgi:hypothetical protein
MNPHRNPWTPLLRTLLVCAVLAALVVLGAAGWLIPPSDPGLILPDGPGLIP